MKVETKKMDTGKVQLDIQIPQDTVKKKFEEVYAEIAKSAKIPGFRPGKAPRDILEKHHSRLAQEEVIKNLIPDAYDSSIKKEKLNVADLPEISDVKLDANVLSFKAVVELMPVIEVGTYKKIKLTNKKVAVTPEELEKVFTQLKESHKITEIDDKFAKGLGYDSVDSLRSSIERQLFLEKESAHRRAMQDEMVKQIVDKVHFTVPQSLVNRRLEELIQQAKTQMARYGQKKEDISAKEESLRKEFLEPARAQVKTFLVLDEIAKKENIPQDEHTVQKTVEFLMAEAEWTKE